MFLWTRASCYSGKKKKKIKRLVCRNIFLQRRKIMWCVLVLQDPPVLKNSGLGVLVPCVKVLFLYAVGLALKTHPNILFLPLNFFFLCRQASWQLWDCCEIPACPTTRWQVKIKLLSFTCPYTLLLVFYCSTSANEFAFMLHENTFLL